MTPLLWSVDYLLVTEITFIMYVSMFLCCDLLNLITCIHAQHSTAK